jgi:hypothetical protein
MARKSRATTKSRKSARIIRQINAIKLYSGKGYSANKIQLRLRARNLGMQRARILSYVRKCKHIQKRAYPERHIPRKYRRPPRPIYEVRALPTLPQFGGKSIAIYGTTRNKKGIVKRNRIELSGSGRSLMEKALLFKCRGYVPKTPYTRKNVNNLTEDDVEKGEWLTIEIESL